MITQKCPYPNCRQPAALTPVIEIPTIRTVGLVQPVLGHLALDHSHMGKMGLNVEMAIRQYEEALEDYKRHRTDLALSDKPTLLIGVEVCVTHAASYKFLDWFGVEEWAHVQEDARGHGVLLDIKKLVVRFEPLGWEPAPAYLELER